jgi:hypothetical protein
MQIKLNRRTNARVVIAILSAVLLATFAIQACERRAGIDLKEQQKAAATTKVPPDLQNPDIQISFRGLLVFHPEKNGKVEIGVHHLAQDHKLIVAIEKIPPAGSDKPSDLTYLPDSASSFPIEFDVKDPHPQSGGIKRYSAPGGSQDPDHIYDYDKLLKFRYLPGHQGAIENSIVLRSKITLNNGYFFSSQNGDVIVARKDQCPGNPNPTSVSFVVGVNIYLAPKGKTVLQYQGGSKDLVADGSTYNITITNLPPEGTFMTGMPPHFRYYYRAFLGVPSGQQYDVCHYPTSLNLVTYEHPCIPVDGG